jgi:hypothetical protein
MALSKKRRPLVLMTGTVIALDPKPEYRDNKPTGNVGRYDVTLLQDNHATPDVRFPIVGEGVIRVPEHGERVALVVDCGETDEYGANFRAVGYVSDDDLEAVARSIPAVASK